MSYDDAQYRVKQIFGPLFASCASAALKVTNSATLKTATSANVTDRVEFFRNIKLVGIKTVTRSIGIVGGSKAISDHSPKVLVFDGTAVVASCALGTVAGVTNSGGVSAASPTIDSTDTLQIKFKAIGDGTAGTFDEISADIYLEYQNRF